MRVRVTLLTENDVNLEEFCKEQNMTKEDVKAITKAGWITVAKMITDRNDSDNNDTCTVENVELLD